MRRSRGVVWVGVSFVACVVGCGSSGNGPTGTSSSSSSAGASSSSGGHGGAGGASTTSSSGTGGASASSSSGNGGMDAGTGKTSTRVFVTSKTYQGTLGGLTGADAECQKLAAAANLGGTWLAWLSSSTTSAGARLTHSTVPYVLVGGGQIAADWADLVDGTHAVAIDHDETGTAIPSSGTTRVWTGTGADGVMSGGNCVGWTSATSGGVYGTLTATDSTWSFTTGNGCDNQDRLYCFEQ